MKLLKQFVVNYTNGMQGIQTKEEVKVLPFEVIIEEIVDYNEMNRIANIICMTTFAVFKRAEMGGRGKESIRHDEI